MVNFCKTVKVKGISLSQKFIENIIAIMENTHCIHHSQVTEEIKDYAHSFCNEKARENYFKMPVVACLGLIFTERFKVWHLANKRH